eukprot:5670197-Karenia_brevis.AAC.1
MSTSSPYIKTGYARLVKSDNCVLCGSTLTHHINHAWDIPQAYEMMRKRKMLEDVRRMLKVAESTKVGLQQVFHCAKAVVSHTRSFNRGRDDSTTWASRTI